jgi:hypothetical protein
VSAAEPRLARLIARQHALDEMLRREAWHLNAPIRATAALMFPSTAHQHPRSTDGTPTP